MSTKFLTLFGLVFLAQAAQSDFTPAEKRCARGVYCADKMVCVSRNTKPPHGMHDDYYQHIVSIRAFKATKKVKGGGRALVDSLQMNADPVGTAKITLAQAKTRAEFDYGNYGPPMRVNGTRVFISWGSASNYSEGIRLVIKKSEQKGDKRIDYLVGSEKVRGDVVGNYSTKLECEAEVVEAPTRIDDLTAP